MKEKQIKMPKTKGHVKVPFIMQMEALECGAASLAMILAYYEKYVTLEQCRIDCGVSRDGSNAKNIMKAAKSYGLIGKAYRLEPETLRKEGPFPCIIHWNFNHFVVLCGFKGNRAVINDPGKGTYTVGMDVFDTSFTGICLTFTPGPDFTPGGKPKSVMSYIKAHIKGTIPAIVFIFITTLITSIIGIINPSFQRIFLDRLLTGENPEWFMPFIIILASVGLIEIVVTFVEEVVNLRLNGKFAAVGNSSFMWKLLRLPMVFYSQRMAGDLQQRKQSNQNIANEIVMVFGPLVLEATTMILYLVVMFRYSWILTLVGVGSLVINLIMSRIISAKRVNITRVLMRDSGKLAGVTVNAIEMIETIKASGAENGYFERWTGYQASVNNAEVKYIKLDAYLGIIPQIVSTLSSILVLILGVFLTIKGEFTVGMILAFQGFLMAFVAPARELIAASQTLQEMKTEIERVDDVMNYPTDVKEDLASVNEEDTFDKLSGNVELKNVTFGYSPLGEPLIENFNLTLKPGSKVALVGASGCGKSTIAKLVSGLYEPWSGEILFDGKSIKEIDRGVFTGSLAVVDQDIILFEDSIRNNIKMWDDSIEDFEMIMAARDAQLHEQIMLRDGGYDYKLTEGGKDFSGGERQRMEIARVLAQDPTIVIMDEATSALDAKTEYEVVKAITARGITCIVVAHRLSTIKDCDEIIVLDYGKVVERGTHEELYKKDGYYKKLVSNE